MENVQKVIQRITAIEQRFGRMQAKPAVNFAKVLSDVENKQNIATGGQAGSIENLVKAAANKYGVDSKLAVAVAVAESGLEPQAVSPAGAVGIMQLMPDTARGLGVNNIYDPQENIDAGVRYLKQMLNSFGGDVSQALAAYNAGPEAVRRYGGVPPYEETREYVNKVVALSR